MWFEPFRDVKTGDYAVFHGVEKPEKRRAIIAVDSQRTLITDLSRDEQEIFSDFSALFQKYFFSAPKSKKAPIAVLR